MRLLWSRDAPAYLAVTLQISSLTSLAIAMKVPLDFIFPKEEKVNRTLTRSQLYSPESISQDQYNLLDEIVSNLPAYPERRTILRKIRSKQGLDRDEIRFLDLFYFTKTDLDVHEVIMEPRYASRPTWEESKNRK